jgi:hypothetical protein
MESIIQQALLSLLDNPLVTGPVILFVLSVIPGPFRRIVGGLVESLMEKAKNDLQDRQDKVAAQAVAAAEQMGGTGQTKKALAVDYVLKHTDVDLATAQTKVEAAVKTMNDYEALARAEFDEFVRGKNGT